MLRQIIQIDKEKCNGCGLCVNACHEGAIGLKEGKAVLLRENYCDGLGDCLPACPQKAIFFEKREAPQYDEAEVKKHLNKNEPLPCGCPGTNAKSIKREDTLPQTDVPVYSVEPIGEGFPPEHMFPSQLAQWPVQIKLVPVKAPYFDNAELLVSADCTAYAYGNFHNSFMKNKITLIGCPKLDECDYSEKLAVIFKSSNIKSITVIRMEVPCCAGIENAVKKAINACGKEIPLQIVIITTDGNLLQQKNK
jgi:NAD-dependent dihydropyrimidine dehydrogenase PreA subunit